MKAFQQNLARLEAADTQVLGVSIDSPFANHAFAEQIGVKFPLLGDVGGEVTKRYGLLTKIDVEGIPVETARRATFLIDKSGKIVQEQVDDKAVNPADVVAACEREKLKR
jgi:glutaredoxin-dependent peroxiredoxin